jgi:phosphatidylglycerophosphatase A
MSMAEALPAAARPGVGVLVATAGGIGFLRPAPGSWASVAAGLAAVVLCLAAGEEALAPALVAGALAALAAGLLSAPAAIRYFSRQDPSQVVIDEVLGTWVAVACIPASVLHRETLLAVAVAVLAFRVFDIAKPWPVGWFERLPGGWGIMADDLAAGLVAGACSAAVLH